jgi:hypothetical protein
MANLNQTISQKFLAKLGASKEVDAEQIERLRALLADPKKPKPDDFVRIFAQPAGGSHLT